MNRLETIAPQLVQQLRKASHAQQRAAAIAAATFAVHRVNVRDANVADACKNLVAGRPLTATQQSELEATCVSLDNEYVQLHTEAEQGQATITDYMDKFVQARAIAALLAAFQSDSLEASSESIYEAAAMSDDNRSLFSIVERVLDHKH